MRDIYFLMNQDEVSAVFAEVPGVFGTRYEITEVRGVLPVGLRDINRWLENRKASKHNAHLRRLMAEAGCERTEGFLRLTHAVSINDCYWTKKEGEALLWKDVSLYSNEFNETISRLAFEGMGLSGDSFSSTSPELTTNGSFRKCFLREDGEILLFKRGTVSEENGRERNGLEPYCEVLASEVAEVLCPGAVRYVLRRLHGKPASCCRLFTSESTGYVPYHRFISSEEGRSPEASLNFFCELDSEDTFRRMMVLDAVIFNDDRHLGNFGALVDNRTQKPVRMAPAFDFNQALFPDLTESGFADFQNALLEYWPRLGNDFTELGQIMLTEPIRKDLERLPGFRFRFRGDENFPSWRVKALERILRRQAEAILDGTIRTSRDVFRDFRVL